SVSTGGNSISINIDYGAPEQPRARDCGNVGFVPASDAGAFNIAARGVNCGTARDVAAYAEGEHGEPYGTASGYSCLPERDNSGALPVTEYTCTRGEATVTFETLSTREHGGPLRWTHRGGPTNIAGTAREGTDATRQRGGRKGCLSTTSRRTRDAGGTPRVLAGTTAAGLYSGHIMSGWTEELARARLHFVTGRGGTGKTTLAAALGRARADEGKRVLLVGQGETERRRERCFPGAALPGDEMQP